MMNPLDDFFPAVFCITLDRRPDRKEQAKVEFEKQGIAVEFISGIDGKTLDLPHKTSSDGSAVSLGDMGCTLSHLKVISFAKSRNLSAVCVFEDDVIFKPEFADISNYLLNLPHDWQMAYFGGDNVILSTPNVPVNGFWRRSFGVNTTHAYAIKNTAYDLAINALSQHEKVDLTLRTIHNKIPVYIASPKVASQRDGFSDILEREAKYPEHLK